jgi:hypothetical protein
MFNKIELQKDTIKRLKIHSAMLGLDYSRICSAFIDTQLNMFDMAKKTNGEWVLVKDNKVLSSIKFW